MSEKNNTHKYIDIIRNMLTYFTKIKVNFKDFFFSLFLSLVLILGTFFFFNENIMIGICLEIHLPQLNISYLKIAYQL